MSKLDTDARLSKSHLNKKLTKKLKNRWIKALESGNYEQCTGALQNDEGQNCCLGVLCRVMSLKHKTFSDYGELGEIGLDKVLSADIQSKLINMNDTDGKSFDEIAHFLKRSKSV